MMTEESLKEKMLKTFRHLKQVHVGREKSKRNLYFNNIHQVAVCIKTSKVHLDNPTQKYWYTLNFGEKSFLEKYKNSYLFLGCLDNSNTAYLIPFHSYKRCFDTAETRWHININHQLYWRCSKGEDINLSQFKVPLLPDERIEGLPETEDRENRRAQGDRPMNDLKSRLLNSYRKIYKKNPHKYIGAMKISECLNLTKEEHGLNYWKTHGLLMELKRDGYLEQSFRHGFRLRKESVMVEETGCNRETDLLKALEKKHKKLFDIMKKTERLKTDIRDLSEYVEELYIEYLDLINKHKKS